MAEIASPAVARLVIRAPNWLGDAVLALPAMAAVRRHFAAAHLAIAAVPGIAPLFREPSSVAPDQIVELPDRPRDAAAALQGGDFELGVLFPNSFQSAWTLRRAGIRHRWGFPTSMRGALLTRRSTGRGAARHAHQADYFRQLVRGLGIACDDAPPRVQVSKASADRANALLVQCGVRADAPLVGFAPGAAYGDAKQWSPDCVAAAAVQIVRDHGATCVIVGASHDRDAARAIESWVRAHAPHVSSRIVDLVGRTSLGGLAGVVARCRVFVANDSGAMHLAAALGRPVVAVFGPTNERATGPIGSHEVITADVFCRPCMLRDCPIDHRCMKRISAETVVSAVSRQLTLADHGAGTIEASRE